MSIGVKPVVIDALQASVAPAFALLHQAARLTGFRRDRLPDGTSLISTRRPAGTGLTS